MKNGIRFGACTMFGLAAFAMATPAHAQATRTWVSGVGDDVNPCSRTAPCKTFAGAISKTAPGGEINCLDPGGFGTLTITKSITIDCTGTMGSTLNSGGINGFVINDSATATPGTINVILRGLSINGAGSTPGLNGIRFISGRSLVLQDVFIQNQKSGSGISIAPTMAVSFEATDVTVTQGLTGLTIQPSSTGSVKATLKNVKIMENTGAGVRIDSTSGASAAVTMTMDDSVNSKNSFGFSMNGGSATVRLMVTNSVIASNTNSGFEAIGTATTIRIAENEITGNNFGVNIAGGTVVSSYGNNRLNANTADVSGTLTPAVEQ